MKKILLLSVILITIVSCKTIQVADLRPNTLATQKKLPFTLTPTIDALSLKSAFNLTSTETIGSSSYIGGGITMGVASSQTKLDKRMVDLQTLYVRSIDNLCSGKTKKGIAELKVTYAKTKKKGFGFALFNAITLCVPGLFGMPFMFGTQDIELEVYIKDLSDNVIGKYTSTGMGKAYKAAYWGYADFEMQRKANIEALKQSLSDITKQIQKDAPNLINELNKN